MAKSANAENVGAAIRPPNYRAAVQIMRHDIKKKKDQISSINESIGEKWGVIEGHGVDKVGARIFMILDKLPEDERAAAFRTINGLADVAEWPEDAEDLVDQAEGKVVRLRTGKAPGDDKTDVDEELKEVEEPKTGAATRTSGRGAALDKARSHLSGGQPADEAPEGDGTLHT